MPVDNFLKYNTGQGYDVQRKFPKLFLHISNLIGKKEFAAAALDPEHEAFVVHVAALSFDSGDEVHPSRRAQIAHLKADEAPTEVPSEYADFADVFSPKL